VHTENSTAVGPLRVILGTLALGFSVFIILVTIVAITSPKELLPRLMHNGGYVWAALSMLMYPLSKRFMRISSDRDGGGH